MRRNPKHYAVALGAAATAAAAALALAGSSAAATSPFSMTDLGVIPGGSVAAINDSGRMIGVDNPSPPLHAYTWTPGGATAVLSLGGSSSQPMALSDSGQVVGWSMTAPPAAQHAFSWTQVDGIVDLQTLGGSRSAALAVNDGGQVVGWSTLPGEQALHAFSWTAGRMVDLDPRPGQTSGAFAVNAAGDVAGTTTTASGATHVFTWTESGGMVDRGWPYGGIVANDWELSDTGRVVTNGTVSGSVHAVTWAPGEGWTDLGTLGGGTSYAYGVNDAGQIVGYSTMSGDATQRAFSWTKAGGMVPIGSAASFSTFAWSVNSAGQVVGQTAAGSGVHAFSWTSAGGTVDLGTLAGDGNSSAYAVSEAGSVYGLSDQGPTSPARHLVLWSDVAPPAAPSTPDLATADDDGASSIDNVTSSTTLVLAGTAEPGATVTLFRDGASAGTARAGLANGEWSIADTVPGIGSYSYTATATDGAGNVSQVSEALVVEVVAPPSAGGGGGGGGGGTAVTQPVAPVVAFAATPAPVAAPLAPPATKAAVRPVIGKPVVVPRKLHAGKAVVVTYRVTRSDTGARLARASMTCDPKLRGRLVAHREQFRNGTATLRFTLPRTAQGMLLQVRLKIKLGSQTATRLDGFRVG